MQLKILCLNELASPECLVGIIDNNVVQVEMVHLAEHLWGIDTCVAHQQVAAIPKGRAGTGIKLTVLYDEFIYMPEGVFSPETAVLGFYVGTFLDGALAIANSDILESQVVRLK